MTTRRVLLVADRRGGALGRADRDEPARRAGPRGEARRRRTRRTARWPGSRSEGSCSGDPDAPVTLVEYVDLQCPYCAEWAVRTFPVLVSDYVRTGKLRIVFHGLAFIGPDSDTALRTALAAGREDRLWDVVAGFYVRQGAENTAGSRMTSSTTSWPRPASTGIACAARAASHG